LHTFASFLQGFSKGRGARTNFFYPPHIISFWERSCSMLHHYVIHFIQKGHLRL
jgi:hypothetical protein